MWKSENFIFTSLTTLLLTRIYFFLAQSNLSASSFAALQSQFTGKLKASDTLVKNFGATSDLQLHNMQTNFNKIDKETGKVRKREDGKVLKPIGWTPPELSQFIK